MLNLFRGPEEFKLIAAKEMNKELKGFHFAVEFVCCYNGHPDFNRFTPDLESTNTAKRLILMCFNNHVSMTGTLEVIIRFLLLFLFTSTQSIRMLSYTFLMKAQKQNIVVPMINFEERGEEWGMMPPSYADDWRSEEHLL
ncbi:hypothetical protein Tco_1469689 [Tanacetum coccineum]